MNDAQDKAVAALAALKDSEFFGLDDDKVTELSLRLSSHFPDGPGAPDIPGMFIAVGAPRSVSLDRNHELPVLVGKRITGRREWEVAFKTNAAVVMADLKTGEVRVGSPFLARHRQEPPPPSGSGQPLTESAGEMVMTGVHRIDLREVFDMKGVTTRLAVSAIAYDWASNVAVIEVLKEGPPPAEAMAKKPSPFLTPPGNAAAKPGAALTVPARADNGAPIPIQGSADLELDRAAVAPVEGSPDKSLLLTTVLFRKLDFLRPIQVDVAAPAQVVDVKGVRRIRATFAFDARSVLKDRLSEGTYQVYLVAGATLSGPYPLKIGAP